MAEGVKLTRDFAERAANVVRSFERQALVIPGPGLKRPLPIPSQGGETINLYNDDSGQTVPPWGCMAVTGFEMFEETTPTLKIVKPSTTFRWDYVFNDDTEFEYEGRKTLRVLRFPKALYDTGMPAVDEGYGATPGQWYLTKNYPEILRVKGIVDEDEKIIYGKHLEMQSFIGELAGTLSQGGSATVNVWGGTAGSEAVISSLTLTGQDFLMKSGASVIASGKDVFVQRINGIVYVTEAECA